MDEDLDLEEVLKALTEEEDEEEEEIEWKVELVQQIAIEYAQQRSR